MSGEPFARAISIDYSDDELDALATAFNRTDLARDPSRAADVPIRRAQQQTALRGLVARRAIALSGSAARPRITFLEPHASLLGAYLGARAVVTFRVERREAVRVVSLFAADEVTVHQEALPGQAIQRLTAHGRDAGTQLLASELTLPLATTPEGPDRFEVTRRMVTSTLDAIDRREQPPERIPKIAIDLLYARIASGSVTLTARDRSGTRSAERWAWLDAGALGLWLVHAEDGAPMLEFVRADADVLGAEIQQAWSAALLAAAPVMPAD